METWDYLVNHIGATAGKIIRISLNALQASCFTSRRGRICRGRSVMRPKTNLTPSTCGENVQSFKICLRREWKIFDDNVEKMTPYSKPTHLISLERKVIKTYPGRSYPEGRSLKSLANGSSPGVPSILFWLVICFLWAAPRAEYVDALMQ